MAWVYLVLAGLFEIAFTTSMRYMGWPLKPWPLIAFLVTSTISFGLLFAATRSIPLGTAYAVWTGIGAAGTVLMGIVGYGEPADAVRLGLLVLLIGAIVGLKLVSAH